MVEESASGPAGALGRQRRGRAVGQDLRGRAVAAVLEGGMNAAAAARRFGLGENTVRGWVKRFRERGHVRPDRPKGGVSRIEPERERIFRILEAQPDLTVRGISRALAAEGAPFSPSAVQRFLKRHNLQRVRQRKRRIRR